jgi:hypothetical protein
MTACSDCGERVDYWQSHCRCGAFVGFPNRRAAEAERVDLFGRENAARATAARSGGDVLISELEALAEGARPVINMRTAVCDDLMRSGKYRTYHQRVASHDRDPATAQNDSDRSVVGARLFPTYYDDIVYASLSPDGSGLTNYDEC